MRRLSGEFRAPVKLMVFPLKNTTTWWRYLASRLSFAEDVVVVSELPDGDIDISPAFMKKLRGQAARWDPDDLIDPATCDDIIRRCRFLRVLDRGLAIRMVLAMWSTVEEILDAEQPDAFLSFVVDRYILDIFERQLRARGVRYVGITVGIVPSHVMFMAKGEYWPVRFPSETEVERVTTELTAPDFVPSYLPSDRFTRRRFVATYAHFTGRWLLFELLRVLRRRQFDFRYLSTRFVDGGYRVRLRDWGVMNTTDKAWEQRLQNVPFEKRIFLALSVNPEAAIDYWVQDFDLVEFEMVIDRLVAVAQASGYHIFVKDHPSQFAFRRVELMQRLAAHDAVTVVPHEVPAVMLIDRCAATFSWTGTVGFQAALAGRCSIVSESAYYAGVEGFLSIKVRDDIDELPSRIESFKPPQDLASAQRNLVRHVLEATVPGSYIASGGYNSWRNFDPRSWVDVLAAEPLVESLNTYVPVLSVDDGRSP